MSNSKIDPVNHQLQGNFLGAYVWRGGRFIPAVQSHAAQMDIEHGIFVSNEQQCWFVDWDPRLNKTEIHSAQCDSVWVIILGFPRLRQNIVPATTSLAFWVAQSICNGESLPTVLSRMEGEFALMVWNGTMQETWLAVDPIGHYALYYNICNDGIVWASHPQSIVKFKGDQLKFSREGLNLYLSLKGVPAPWTLLEDIKKVCPGHALRVTREGVINTSEYWTLAPVTQATESFNSSKHNLKSLLFRSVEKFLQDTSQPAGVFLSGGLDSTILVAIARLMIPLHAFSVGYVPYTRNDETKYAVQAAEALKISLTVHRVSAKDIMEVAENAIAQLPEPIADMAFLPQLFLAYHAISPQEIVLDGTGADAIFGGSNKFIAEYYRNAYLRVPYYLRTQLGLRFLQILPASRRWRLTNWVRKGQYFSRGAEIDDSEERTVFWSRFFESALLAEILTPEWTIADDLGTQVLRQLLEQGGDGHVSKISYMTLKGITPWGELAKLAAIRRKTASSIRNPFLSPALVEFALALPDSYKVFGRQSKVVLRKAFEDMVPSAVLQRPKANFTPPIGQWLTRDLRALFWENMGWDDELFNLSVIRRMWREQHLGWRDWSSELWAIFVLQTWRRLCEQ